MPLGDFSDNPAENGRCPPTQNGKTLILVLQRYEEKFKYT